MRKHLKKGFTLIELLVVLLLMGLIFTALVMAMKPVMNIYADINYKTDEENGSISLFDFINGDLRYATEVQIMSTDTDAMPAAGNYKNFIVLSNKTRPDSKKKARGYAKYGKTSDPSNSRYCVDQKILGENDFQFSLESYNTANNEQSMTIAALAHPMKENSTRSGFEVNTRKPYNYKEAIQFVNMRYATQLPNLTVNFSPAGYDASKPYHWILYTKPSDLGTSAATPPSGNTVFKPPATDHKGNKKVDYGAALNELTIIFQETTIPFFYRIVADDCNISYLYTDGTKSPFDPTNTSMNPVGGNVTLIATIPTGKELQIRNGANMAMLLYKKTGDQMESEGSQVIYIYNDGTMQADGTTPKVYHDDPYSPPGSLPDPKELFIHYLYKETDEPGYGVTLTDADTNNLVTANYDYYDNSGSRKTGPINNGGNVWIGSEDDDKDITVRFSLADGEINLKWARDNGSVIGADFGNYKAADIPDGGKHIYIYGGAVYDSNPMPDAINHTSTVHFIYNSEMADCNGLGFKDVDTLKRSSTTDYGNIPEGQMKMIAANQGSLEVKCTIIKQNGKVGLWTVKDGANAYAEVINDEDNAPYIIDENSPEHIWVYNNRAYSSKDEIPGFKPIDKEITIHYLQGARNASGVAMQDVDNFFETSKVGSDFIPEQGMIVSSSDEDFEVKLYIVKDGGKVGLGLKDKYTDNMLGGILATLDKDSPDHVWVYKNTYYGDDEAKAKADRDADAASGSTGLDVSVTWSGSTQNWGARVWVGKIKVKNNASDPTGPFKVVVKFNGNVDASRGAYTSGNELFSNCEVNGDTITYTFDDIKAGEEIGIMRYQDCQIYCTDDVADFSVIEAYAE